MFAKRSKSQQPPPTDDDSQTAQSGADVRAATTERLERELEEQRHAAKTLRESLDALAFQKEILEKSYAKQLAETREKLTSLEAELKEKDEILANLDGGQEQTLRELTDALTVIKVLKKERDQFRKQASEGGGHRPAGKTTTKARALLGADAYALGSPPPGLPDYSAAAAPVNPQVSSSDDDTSGGTINALIANAGWGEKKAGTGTGQATAQVEAPQPQAQEEMLSPDLVFEAKDKEKDDDER